MDKANPLLSEMALKTPSWLSQKGPLSQIVVSSRIRLARNLQDVPFCPWAKRGELDQVLRAVKAAAKRSPLLKNLTLLSLHHLSALDCFFLMERHLVSQELAMEGGARAVIFDADEITSLMVNEEDHLRLQRFGSGLCLVPCWGEIAPLDRELRSLLPVAVSQEFGYLTACPTNVGTGLRASVMVHLPGLVQIRQIDKVTKAVTQLGLAVRGLYGENTSITSDFFQISNEVTLGKREEDIISGVEKVARQIYDYEESARRRLMAEAKNVIYDKVGRAHGLLKSAHLLNFEECMEYLSAVRLGVDLQILKDVSMETLNELLFLIQPAHLQKLAGSELVPEEIDSHRAKVVREKLGNASSL